MVAVWRERERERERESESERERVRERESEREREREWERARRGSGHLNSTVKLGYYVPSRETKKRYVLTKVRSIQNTTFLTGRTGSTCSRERSATEDASPSWVSFITRFSCGEIAFHGIVNLKTCRKLKSKLKGWMTCLWSEKKEQKKGQRVLLEGKLVRNIRFCAAFRTSYPKKCKCFPIGDVRDRRRERYNRVYVLSRVRTNRVSL